MLIPEILSCQNLPTWNLIGHILDFRVKCSGIFITHWRLRNTCSPGLTSSSAAVRGGEAGRQNVRYPVQINLITVAQPHSSLHGGAAPTLSLILKGHHTFRRRASPLRATAEDSYWMHVIRNTIEELESSWVGSCRFFPQTCKLSWFNGKSNRTKKLSGPGTHFLVSGFHLKQTGKTPIELSRSESTFFCEKSSWAGSTRILKRVKTLWNCLFLHSTHWKTPE